MRKFELQKEVFLKENDELLKKESADESSLLHSNVE